MSCDCAFYRRFGDSSSALEQCLLRLPSAAAIEGYTLKSTQSVNPRRLGIEADDYQMLRLPNLAWVCFRTEACDGHLLNPTSSRRASRRLGHGQQYESPVRRHLGEACPQVEDSPRRKILEAISARWPLLAGTASTWLLMNMCGAWTCRLSLPSMHVIKSRRVCRLSFAIAPLVNVI